ncbi:phasin family protein [Paraburkholderia monticola]|nr:phasin family protein [Paraburkholderia monticola]
MTMALSAKPEELIALSTRLAKPTAEKFTAYSRHVYELCSPRIRTGLARHAPLVRNATRRCVGAFL